MVVVGTHGVVVGTSPALLVVVGTHGANRRYECVNEM